MKSTFPASSLVKAVKLLRGQARHGVCISIPSLEPNLFCVSASNDRAAAALAGYPRLRRPDRAPALGSRGVAMAKTTESDNDIVHRLRNHIQIVGGLLRLHADHVEEAKAWDLLRKLRTRLAALEETSFLTVE